MASARGLAVGVIGLVSALCGAARADVVSPPSHRCPEGSTPEYAHHGAWCAAATCPDDGCPPTASQCAARQVCVVDVRYRGSSSGWTGPVDESYVVVVGPCDDGRCVNDVPPYESAQGYADPAGWTKSESECRTLDVCVTGPAPGRAPTPPEEPDPVEPTDPAAPRTTAPPTSTPPASGTGRCGCHAPGAGGGAAPIPFAVALGLLVGVRRRR